MDYKSAKSLFDELETDRLHYDRRARECAKVTIPSLFPEKGTSSASKFRTPYQSLGSRGLKNLSSKLLLALLPPNANFFRMTISSSDLQKLSNDETARNRIEEAFAAYEREVTQNIESSNIRPVIFEALKQFLLAGNVLLYLPDKGGVKYYRLDRYVVKRDPMGEPTLIIVRDSLSRETLPPELKGFDESLSKSSSGRTKDNNIDLYTVIRLEDDKWMVHQELEETKVADSEGWYPKDESPWLALRCVAIADEDYGRSYVEEHLGDLISFEKLSQAVVQGSAEAARIIHLIDPNGITKASAITKAESGDVVAGREADVHTHQLNKSMDLSVASNTLRELKEALSFAFLLNTAIQRNGERVTAEEIRYMAGELEDALGGMYSILSREFQLPFVRRIIARMTTNGELPRLPDGTVKPAITTGLEALGRGQDLNKLDLFVSKIVMLGPQVVEKYIKMDGLISRIGSATNVDPKGLIRTPEEIQAEEQRQMLMAAAQSSIPNAVNNLTPNISAPIQNG
jgi:hypothetical protein